MEEWISYAPFRREEWKGHDSKKAVRQAIAQDRGRKRLRLFSRGVDPTTKQVFFILVPRDQWEEMFAG